MTLPDAVEPDQLKVAAIVVLAVLVLLFLLIMRFVRKMVFRVILAGVLIATGVLVYAQRDELDQCQKDLRAKVTATGGDVRCTCTFAGFDVTVPQCPALEARRGG